MGKLPAILSKFCLAALLYLPIPASAGLVFSNGAPTLPPFGPEITTHEVAAKFTIAAPATVTSIDFWSYELNAPFGGYAGSIDWNIFLQDPNTSAPSTVIGGATGVTPTRQSFGTYTVANFTGVLFQNTFNISSLQLNAGNYLLGLKNGPASLTSFNGFFWVESDPLAGPLKISFTQTGPNWTSSGLGLSFQLNGNILSAIPEPSTFVFTAAGLLTMIVGVSRRKRR